MSLPPALPFGSPTAAIGMDEKDRGRARVLITIFSICAVGAGAFAALASQDVLPFVGGLLVIVLAAWAVPLPWTAVLLAAVLPFQLYLSAPGTFFTLRAALVLSIAIAARIAIAQRPSPGGGQPSSLVSQLTWLLPAALFLLVAVFAAFGAQDRYAAFKGIYDWLAVFITAFVFAQLRPRRATVRRILVAMIAAGVLQALLGLLQYMLGLDAVLGLLRLPASGLLYQPNLLRDRLNDLSFNWVTFDRALPFGTFINGIDYAVFLAATLSLIIALVITAERRPTVGSQRSWLALAASGLIIAIALLLTFKGSGALALLGGIAVIVVVSLPRLSRQTMFAALFVLAGALVLVLPFSDLLVQRALYLIQREQGLVGSVGRLAIWTSLLQFVPQRPLFGYGLNNWISLIEPQLTLHDGASTLVLSAPESAYVSTLVDTGLVGFVALASWLLGAVVTGYRYARRRGGMLYVGIVAALVALLAGNLTVSGLTTDQNGMLLGMLVGLIYGMERNE